MRSEETVVRSKERGERSEEIGDRSWKEVAVAYTRARPVPALAIWGTDWQWVLRPRLTDWETVLRRTPWRVAGGAFWRARAESCTPSVRHLAITSPRV